MDDNCMRFIAAAMALLEFSTLNFPALNFSDSKHSTRQSKPRSTKATPVACQQYHKINFRLIFCSLFGGAKEGHPLVAIDEQKRFTVCTFATSCTSSDSANFECGFLNKKEKSLK